MPELSELFTLGQSVWYDNVRRALLDTGDIDRLIESGVRGITSNPSIFEKAIAGSSDYDVAINELAGSGAETKDIYEELVIEDIQRGADALMPVFVESNGHDGYISLEVSPRLAYQTDETISEARRLFERVGRPNLMIKVPATEPGIPAIRTLVGEGINVNVTLIFSLQQYNRVAEAYLQGLEDLVHSGGDPGAVASVASFFVSRVDTAVDRLLTERGAADLQGEVAVANAKMAYLRSKVIYFGARWEQLRRLGAKPQRLLWASTSTKNPAYSKTKYVDELIGAGTVNTVPPATLQQYILTGAASPSLGTGTLAASQVLVDLDALGVNIDEVTSQLLEEGVAKFAKSFESLMDSVALKKKKLLAEHNTLKLHLGKFDEVVRDAMEELKGDDIVNRIWNRDHTVWSDSPVEIVNRLGWLDSPEDFVDAVEEISDLKADLMKSGFTDVLLLGMGGSSLAPEVLATVFTNADGMRLQVVDSTDPDLIRDRSGDLDLTRTLFIVATKSGGTVETLSVFKYFYNQVAAITGLPNAGAHFVAITDPGSKLVALAEKLSFRKTFVNDPDIGGRYSVISFFGLVPAILLGLDANELLDRAHRAAVNAHGCNCAIDGDNNAAVLGTVMGALAQAGRDKLTFVVSPALQSFGDWVEQLIAESTGKDGKGILPVVGERVADPDEYGSDRLFVHIHLVGDQTFAGAINRLIEAGQPVVQVRVDDLYDIGQQFFLWEMATAIAGYFLGIQPFDQPNVESAKVLARSMVETYVATGALPSVESAVVDRSSLKHFLSNANDSDYISIQAYLNPTEETTRQLQELRTQLQMQYRLATTIGIGPRFLHSTGQLHKGDSGNGLFVQLISSARHDLSIPDEAGSDESQMSFDLLKKAQALGDAQALRNENRRLIRFDLGADVAGSLEKLITN